MSLSTGILRKLTLAGKKSVSEVSFADIDFPPSADFNDARWEKLAKTNTKSNRCPKNPRNTVIAFKSAQYYIGKAQIDPQTGSRNLSKIKVNYLGLPGNTIADLDDECSSTADNSCHGGTYFNRPGTPGSLCSDTMKQVGFNEKATVRVVDDEKVVASYEFGVSHGLDALSDYAHFRKKKDMKKLPSIAF